MNGANKKGPEGPHGPQRGRALLRPDHHHHLAAFQPGHGFDLARIANIGGDPVQQFQTQLLVRHFAATEAQGDLDLVALFQKLQDRAHLHVVIMGIGPGTELDFLDLDDVLLLARLGLALLRLVFVLAEIHDLADRRFGIGRDFDQIQTRLFGKGHSARRGDHADILSISPDQANFR